MTTLKEFQPQGATHFERLSHLAEAVSRGWKERLDLTDEQLEDYINGMLVITGVRKAYLIQNLSNTHNFKRIEWLKKTFTNLKSLTLRNYTFIS